MKAIQAIFLLSLVGVAAMGFPLEAAAETEQASSRLDAAGNIDFQVLGETALRLAAQGTVCDSKSEGAIRYNKAEKYVEGCDGSAWKQIGAKKGNYYGLQESTMIPYGGTATSSSMQFNGTTPVSVSVSGPGSPMLSINGGSWVSAAVISPGQRITLRATAAKADQTTTVVTLTTGEQQDTWSITTAPKTYARDYASCGRWVYGRVGMNNSDSYSGLNCEGQDGCEGKHTWMSMTCYNGNALCYEVYGLGDNCVQSGQQWRGGNYVTN